MWINFIVCLLFGYLGVHKFREKKYFAGLLYLFTLGLFGFGWLYDCVKYLVAAIKVQRKNDDGVVSQNQAEPMLRAGAFMIIMKRVGAWCLTLFFATAALVYLPNFSGFIAIGIFLLVLPMEKWQALLGKFITGKIKAIAAVILAVIMISIVPVPENVDSDDSNATVAVEVETDGYAALENQETDDSTAAQHEHYFLEATCIEPRKCSICGETDGGVGEHSWEEATCEIPKTCTICGETEGDIIEHSWQEATCSVPKTCAVCKLTEGDLTEHSWVDATCSAPRTCSVCGETEGSAAEHSWIDATCSNPQTCAECGVTEGSAAEHDWEDADCSNPKTCSKCGETEGTSTGHIYVSGKCSSCGGTDPSYVSEAMVWIPTNGGTKYHTHSGCSNMKNPRKVTISEARALGFTPCKRCY